MLFEKTESWKVSIQSVEIMGLHLKPRHDDGDLSIGFDAKTQRTVFCIGHNSLTAGVADRSASRVEGRVIQKARKPSRWMRCVRAIEDHGENTITIRGKDRVKRVVQGTQAKPLDVELVDGPSVDEWEIALAEDEIARLADELEGYDYVADQGKAEQSSKTSAASEDPTGSRRGEGPFDALLDRECFKVSGMVAAWSSGKELRQYSMDAAICESKPMSLRTMHGFPTKRRPQLREVSDASQVEVDE
ncbi:hypothetical protein HO173_003156 [Letharia columbiana]|uniref:Uncharacterized protein n=1 Tax=Letharia columbiana TaxID=112416 RepID=A0A8H6L7Q4_9LECA|nr:uncharacterized protein HO173_003156 [Letharia columbiana]KAF6238650.1 hypothetical protein HO173_003156 [Letharia columbiana]